MFKLIYALIKLICTFLSLEKIRELWVGGGHKKAFRKPLFDSMSNLAYINFFFTLHIYLECLQIHEKYAVQKMSDMKNLIGLLNKMIFLIYLRYFKNLANGLREFVNPQAYE
jgi:hypothetical protein